MSSAAQIQVGRVVAAHGRHCVVEDPQGQRVICHPRGKKSDVVVGDRVRWQASGDSGVIEGIEPRRNVLTRQDEWKTKTFAANIDQLLVIVAAEPVFSESQLARALIAAQDAAIPVRILLNKADLASVAAARSRLAPYVAMGIEVHEVALKARPDEARERLGPLLADLASLAIGPSGAGKSTLINLLAPHAKALIGELSSALNAGRHTTTATHWYWLSEKRRTALIDSPGFQEFGMRLIDAQQLAALMPDLRNHVGDCKFYNCTHLHEPGCAVRDAVQRGEIHESRYRIYAEILGELVRR
ncbi:MAG: ribosome small subunit-dependent GTPase A [Burkholderiaceae bacterium]